MIRVRILGKGLIPRGGGLAPKKEPIYVDLDYLTILVYSRNLRIQYLNPDTDKFEDLLLSNFKKIYDKVSPKVNAQLEQNSLAKKKAAEEAEAKRKAEEEAKRVKEAELAAERERQQQQQFQKRDKYFNKKKYEQRNKPQQEVQEVVEEKTEA